MTVSVMVTLTVLVLTIFPMLGAFVGASRGEALVSAVVGFFWGVGLCFWGWVIFVVVHFVTKFW